MHFHSALAILEPQIYVVVEQFGAENISLLSGRLGKILFEIYESEHFRMTEEKTCHQDICLYIQSQKAWTQQLIADHFASKWQINTTRRLIG